MDGSNAHTILASKTKRLKTRAAPSSDVVPVLVSRELLHATRERTGMSDDAELVAFALRVLNVPDPSAEYARKHRGTLPGLELDI